MIRVPSGGIARSSSGERAEALSLIVVSDAFTVMVTVSAPEVHVAPLLKNPDY